MTSRSQRLLGKLRRHLPHLHSGKVRESFRVRKGRKSFRLVFATDRISIFDFVLGFLIPGKGEILNAMNIFWFLYLREKMPHLRQDIVAFGAAIDEYLPEELRNDPELQKRAIIVENLRMIPVELVVRKHLLGSAWKAYIDPKKKRTFCGQQLPAGLREGEELDDFFFTPTTKAKTGHDLPRNAYTVEARYPGIWKLAVEMYSCAYDKGEEEGVRIADSKTEVGRDRKTGEYVLGDERFTCDSSRLWSADEFYALWPTLPGFMDKEEARIYGRGLGIHKLDPKNPKDRKKVAALPPGPNVIPAVQRGYTKALKRLTGSSLARFQQDVMGITV